MQKRVADRKELKHPDYFSLLVPEHEPPPPDDFLVAQANHLIVGGFDPDTNLFTAVVHYLLEYLRKFDRFKSEIRDNLSNFKQLTNDALQSLPYLHAVIEESLRLHTNGAFGLPRISLGDIVDGYYIPQEVRVPPESSSTFINSQPNMSFKYQHSQSVTRSAISKML